MPVISRLRLVNVRYDRGTKMFTDDVFDLGGTNSLFNLTNGGGKTVLLQLMLQVVLPCEDLGRERKFNSFFEGMPQRSSHILVEWRLDSSDPRYLLTGLCATRTQGQDDGCQWFAYTRDYKENDTFRIDTVPLVDAARRPVSYHELRKQLKARSDTRLRIFGNDDKAGYGRHLEEFGIFPSEWEAIKRINLSEGGIEKFFERCRTARDCLEVLMIPHVEELLTKDDAVNRRELSDSFANHFEVLKRIPEWVRMLHELEEFRTAADRYIAAVDRYHAAATGVAGLFAGLNRLHARIITRKTETKRELEEWKAALARNDDELRDLDHRRASFELYQLHLHITHLTLELEHRKALQGAAIDEKERTARLIRLSEAASAVCRLDKALAEAAVRRQELAELDAAPGQTDLTQQLYQCEFSLAVACRAELETIEREQTSLQRELETTQKRQNAHRIERDRLLAERKQLDESFGRLSGEQKTRRDDLSALLEPFSLEDRLDPAAAASRLEAKSAECGRRRTVLDAELARLERETAKIEDEREQLQAQENAAAGVKADLRRRRETFETDLAGIRQMLRQLQLDVPATPNRSGRLNAVSLPDPWAPETLSGIMHLIRERTIARRRSQLESLSLREQEALLRDRDWMPVNADIERLRDALRQHGLSVLSGGEYLGSIADEESRRRALAGSPLLPYGLVVSASELADPAHLPLPDVPVRAGVPLICRETLQESDPNPPGRLSQICAGSALLEYSDRDLFILPERRAAYAADLARRLNTANADAESLERAVDDLNESLRRLEGFREKYPAGTPGELSALESEAETVQRRLADQKAELERNLVKFRQETVAARDETTRLDRQKTVLADRLNCLARCLELSRILDHLEGEIRRIDELRTGLANEFQAAEAGIAVSEETAGRLRERLHQLDALAKHPSALLEELRIPESWNEAWPDSESLQGLEAIRRSLKDRLAGFYRSREELVNAIKRQEDLAQSWATHLERTGIPADEARAAPPAPEVKTAAWSEIVRRREQEIATLGKEIVKLSNDISGKEGEHKAKKQIIESGFGRPPVSVFKADFEAVEREMEQWRKNLENRRVEMTARIKELDGLFDIFHDTSSILATFLENLPPSIVQAASTESTDETDIPPQELAEQIRLRIAACRKAMGERDEKHKAIDHHQRQLNQSFGGSTIQALKTFVASIGTGDAPDDPAVVRSVFGTCFGIIDKLREDTRLQQSNARKDQEELTRQCVEQVGRFIEELRQIDHRSKIDVDGKSVKMVEIHLDEVDPELRGRRIHEYVERMVRDLGGEADAKQLRAEIEKRLQPARLLDAACDLNKARIRVRKPARPPNRPRTADWEEVPKFSGGEKFICYFALYISLLTYIRAKRTGGTRSKKVLLADNPFGRMSADFLLDGMFALADHTDTQMICFTALKESSILQHFPRLFSMVLRHNIDGREIMTTDALSQSLETARFALPRQPVLF